MIKENKHPFISKELSSYELLLFNKKKLHFSDGRLTGSAYFDFCHIDQNKNDREQLCWNFSNYLFESAQLPVRLYKFMFHLPSQKTNCTLRKCFSIPLHVPLIGIINWLCVVSSAFFPSSQAELINIVQPISKFKDLIIRNRHLKFLNEFTSRIVLLEICK